MKKAGAMFIKNLRYLCLVGVIALGLMTIVGTGGGGGGGGPSVGTVIGPEGGVVEKTLDDGTEVVMDIPEDALSEDTEIIISISPINNVPYATEILPVLDFGPSGTTLNKPITVTYTIPIQTIQKAGYNSLEEGKEFLMAYHYNSSKEKWEIVDIIDVDYSTNSVTIQINHFSPYVIIVYHVPRVKTLRLHSPVKKGEHLHLEAEIAFPSSAFSLVDLKANLEWESGHQESEYGAATNPGDPNHLVGVVFSELNAPNDEQFAELTIELVFESSTNAELWKQKIVVDYDQPTIDQNELEALLNDYCPAVQFTSGETYFPADITEVFDINNELKYHDSYSILENINDPGLLSRYSSMHHGFVFDKDDLLETQNRIYATAIEEGQFIYLTYIFYYHYEREITLF